MALGAIAHEPGAPPVVPRHRPILGLRLDAVRPAVHRLPDAVRRQPRLLSRHPRAGWRSSTPPSSPSPMSRPGRCSGCSARITRTFFVRRHWRQALIQRNALAARMRAGESFILFARGHQRQRARGTAAQDQPAQRRRAVGPGLPGRRAGRDPGLCPARRRQPGRSAAIATATRGTATPSSCRISGTCCRWTGSRCAPCCTSPSLSWSVQSRKIARPRPARADRPAIGAGTCRRRRSQRGADRCSPTLPGLS